MKGLKDFKNFASNLRSIEKDLADPDISDAEKKDLKQKKKDIMKAQKFGALGKLMSKTKEMGIGVKEGNSTRRLTKDDEKEIISDVFGKNVSLDVLKSQLKSGIKSGNRLMTDEQIDEGINNILKGAGLFNTTGKFKNKMEGLKDFFDKNSKAAKIGTGLKEGRSTRKVTAKDGSRTKVRGTGAAKKGFRKARLS